MEKRILSSVGVAAVAFVVVFVPSMLLQNGLLYALIAGVALGLGYFFTRSK